MADGGVTMQAASFSVGSSGTLSAAALSTMLGGGPVTLRANTLKELVQFGKGHARVEGRWLLNGAERTIAVEVSHGTRSATVHGKPPASVH